VRVLLVSANTERVNMVTLPIGLGLVSAAARRAGHDVALLDLLAEPSPDDAIRRAVAAHRPEVIGISIRNIDDQCRRSPRFLLPGARRVVEACRARSSAPIVVGGAGYSIFPEEALAYLGADYGVAGDGEVATAALLRALERGEPAADIAGVYRPGCRPTTLRAREPHLDPLPRWDETLLTLPPEDVWVPVQSRRGCPNDCSYCSTSRIQGRTIRCRSAADVTAHVRDLAARGLRRIFFVDNSFNLPEALALALCRALEGIEPPVTWRCILYPERVREELVSAMARAGCVEVALGFESGSLRVLREMNKRFTPEDVRVTAALLARHGIRRLGFLLLGGPGETPASVRESLAFAESLRLDELRTTVGIRIYPGTPLARRAVAEGVVAADDSLLEPRFYLAPGLEPWIHDRVAAAPGPGYTAS
jgi:radical SAM superfamily enzyme YgiQ (UPF0313 family)